MVVSDQLLLNLLYFCIFTVEVIWLLSDPRSLKEKIKDFFQVEVLVYELSLLIFLALFYFNYTFFQFSLGTWYLVLQVVGLALFFAGCSLGLWARALMGQIWNPAGRFNLKRQNQLVTTGPFAFSRHPIYLGIILGSLGFFLSLRSPFIFLVLVVWYRFYQASKREEMVLIRNFGNTYLKYRSQTPLFLFFKN